MQHKLEVYLWEIKDLGDEIVAYAAGKSLEDYLRDRTTRLAVERLFTVMGEAMVRVRKNFPAEFVRLADAPKVIHFRNLLMHRYDVVDDAQVWRIIEAYLPALLSEVSVLIGTIHQ